MLLHLPVELQLLVVDFVSPRDIPSLRACCKHIQTLTHARFEEHKELAAAVANIPNNRDGHYKHPNLYYLRANNTVNRIPYRHGGGGTHCTRALLLHLIKDQRIGCYIDTLEMSTIHPLLQLEEWLTPARVNTPDHRLRVSLDGEDEIVAKWIRESPLFTDDDERKVWIDAYGTGRRNPKTGGALLALLLAQLPRLKGLRIEDSGSDPLVPYVGCILSRLAARSRAGYPHQALSCLESVHVKCNTKVRGSRAGEAWEASYPSSNPGLFARADPEQFVRMLYAFMTLPALRRLSLYGWFGLETAVLPSSAPHPDYAPPLSVPSQLQSITLEESYISSRQLSLLLQNCPNLETFKYTLTQRRDIGNWTTPLGDIEPEVSLPSILTVLGLSPARSTLKTLHVAISGFDGRCACRSDPCLMLDRAGAAYHVEEPLIIAGKFDMHNFLALGRIILDIDLFDCKPGGGWPPLAEMLPISVREVHILAADCLRADSAVRDVQAVLRGFNPQLHLPNLRCFAVWHRNTRGYPLHGPEHLIPVFKSRLLDEARIPPGDVEDYQLDDMFFWRRRIAAGITLFELEAFLGVGEDVEMYSLPDEDMNGYLIMGVYHATAVYHQDATVPNNRQDWFDGVRMRRT